MSGSGKFERTIIPYVENDDHEVIRLRDGLFNQILGELGLDNEYTGVTVETLTLGRNVPFGESPTFNYLHTLEVHDELIGLLMDRRHEEDFHELTLWQNPPSEKCLELIKR